MSDGTIEDPMPDHPVAGEEEDDPEIAAIARRSKTAAEGRRPRGWLEADVKRVCDQWITGEIRLEGDPPLTPHRAGMLVKKMDELDEAPSTGAVAAVFDRWAKIGFAEFTTNPRAFKDYTEQGRTRGLAALKAEESERKKQAREAKKDQVQG